MEMPPNNFSICVNKLFETDLLITLSWLLFKMSLPLSLSEDFHEELFFITQQLSLNSTFSNLFLHILVMIYSRFLHDKFFLSRLGELR